MVVSVLPAPVLSVLSAGRPVGFSGSRSVAPPSAVLGAVVSVLGVGASVCVGCAAGADRVVRSAFPSARVFAVVAPGRGGFAARSVALVRSVSALVAFPSRPCPVGLVPSSSSSRCFCGLGSGSWASVAFAAGLGLPVAVWLPAGVAAPAWLAPVGGGWWCPPPAPVSQLALF